MPRALRRAGALALASVLAGLSACGGGRSPATAPQGSGTQAAAQSQDPGNPLIGRWQFVGFGKGPVDSPSGCSIDMTFSPSQWTQTQGGATTNTAVTYIPSAKVVYVVGSDGGHITYVLVDQNHIALDLFAPCTYARVG
jgi:hypothetical protein